MKEFEPIFKKMESHFNISDNDKKQLLPLLSKKEYSKGDYFIRAGEIAEYAGYMYSGLLRYYYIGPEGEEYTKYFCHGENFVSSYSSLITGEPSDFSIQVLEPTKIILFKYNNWVDLIDKNPTWSKINKSMMDYAHILSEKRERSLILEDAKTRYVNFLKEFPGIENKVTLTDIATYLGITLVTLSRIRKKMK